MKKKIIITKDGSPSIFVDELNETYHSKNGALTESNHIYINRGLGFWLETTRKKHLKIFEMGLGTGLNAYLSYIFLMTHELSVDYLSIEKFPLTNNEIKTLKMKCTLPVAKYHDFFDQLHNLEWNSIHRTNNFSFQKIKGDFLEMRFEQFFDVLFYDSFGYHAQPEMWDEKALAICFNMLKPEGVWVSYCAKGQVRRDLEKVGFSVERLEGPPGKREMLRAIKLV